MRSYLKQSLLSFRKVNNYYRHHCITIKYKLVYICGTTFIMYFLSFIIPIPQLYLLRKCIIIEYVVEGGKGGGGSSINNSNFIFIFCIKQLTISRTCKETETESSQCFFILSLRCLTSSSCTEHDYVTVNYKEHSGLNISQT